MITEIKLEKIEEDALKVISTGSCTGISCKECPLITRYNGTNVCIKNIATHILEAHQSKDRERSE